MGAPDDTDFDRWAMLHDGEKYRLYFMPYGSDDTLYQFVFDEEDWAYEYGHETGVNDEIAIVGAPQYANMSSISMLHDGEKYRLYARAWNSPDRLVQFAYEPAEGAYVYQGEASEIRVTGTPNGAYWGGWAMLGDADEYRLYAYGTYEGDDLVQHGYDPSVHRYEYGHESKPVIDIVGRASTCNDDFAMLHDGERYRLYVVDTPH